uniref:Uncharacterized protein n=1 Tax=Leersia perrieri TaxID=77586 RepID=A0A0D9XZX7_9ORYZ
MAHSMMRCQVTCTEILGNENGGSHVDMEILPQEVRPESKLKHMHEKRRLGKEPRLPLPPTMPWRGKHIVLDRRDGRLLMSQVPSRLPFSLQASRVDGRFRLSLLHPSDGDDELSIVSNGKKDVEDHEKGTHGKKDVESIENEERFSSFVMPHSMVQNQVMCIELLMH